ncbi:MAG: DUF4336 domain-containing protein [Alphaproteobacteria bacterium]
MFDVEPYEPINSFKPIAENIWIVDGPLISFKGVPFPTRMTVIKLADGSLFVHSPTDPTPELRAQINDLGPVSHLISPNKIHYWWIDAWATHYRQAKKWAAPGSRPAAARQGWEFDGDLGHRPEPQWSDEIDQLIVEGGRFMDEVVFFHKASRTLILTDLIENFELSKVRSPIMRCLLKFAGNVDPDGKMPIDLRLSYCGRHPAIREGIQRMIAWAPERIILAHGRNYEIDATGELYRAFRWVRGIDQA